MEENKDYMQQPEGTVGAENSQAGDEYQERQENAPYRQRRRINNAERITPSPRSYQSDKDDFNRPYRRYNNYEDSHYHIVIMAGIREKIEYNDIPGPFKGSAIVLVTAGLMAMAFFGFSGVI